MIKMTNDFSIHGDGDFILLFRVRKIMIHLVTKIQNIQILFYLCRFLYFDVVFLYYQMLI